MAFVLLGPHVLFLQVKMLSDVNLIGNDKEITLLTT